MDIPRYWGATTPNRIALRDPDRTVTYSDLEARSDRVAAAIAGRGITPGSHIGVLAKNCLEFFELWFGAAEGLVGERRADPARRAGPSRGHRSAGVHLRHHRNAQGRPALASRLRRKATEALTLDQAQALVDEYTKSTMGGYVLVSLLGQKTSSPAVAPGVSEQIQATVLDPTTNLNLDPISAPSTRGRAGPRSTGSSSPPQCSSTFPCASVSAPAMGVRRRVRIGLEQARLGRASTR